MEKVKIKDVKTGATKEVLKELAGDFIGTGRFIMAEETKKEIKEENNNILSNKN